MSPLTDDEKQFLLRVARRAMEASVRKEKREPPPAVSPGLQTAAGAFVSLHRGGHLRGCVGYIQSTKPLVRTVMEAAEAAALHDSRFAPVRPEELPELDVEVSVLSPCRKASPEEVQVGVHGLLVTWQHAHGLLLPQVAAEHQWDRERFLAETCRKAGLPPDAWRRGATLEVFTAEVFGERALEAGVR